ncbi:MAG: hypothetical protein P4L59_09570 [Desulfosporosinus sp.]|nr:hypothetical protein [Desulfosporosinus sp.]
MKTILFITDLYYKAKGRNYYENGELLLVELEDLNPYLSLLELNAETCNNFIEALKKSFHKVLI